MGYLAEELRPGSSKSEASDLSIEELRGGLEGSIERLDSLETELSQRDHESFESLIDMLRLEVRDLALIRDALLATEEATSEATTSLQMQLREAVSAAKAR